jgi:Tol biopolymer transport system component/DNA-binding winged helix-turn-helix (wHTH) protein
MSLAVNHLHRFGEFTVDGQQKVLLRNGSPLALAPKVFDTLLILVDNSGRIVEKEELMHCLWPDSFVEESNLTFNIQQLRKALGDNARQPQFIETVPRRGYRFIAEVKEDAAPLITAKPELSSGNAATLLPASWRSYLSIASLAVLVIGAIAIALWFARSRIAASSESRILSAPFKSEKFATGGIVRAVITPDGRYVAYTSETGGKESIWLRQLETSENIQIVPPTDQRYLGLAVSHDGNSLYFVRKNISDDSSALFRVMTFGGIPLKIAEHTEGTVSVSPDDKQLSFMRCNYRDDDFCSLHVIDADGKNERSLLKRKRPFRLVGCQFSPDGKSIAFASGQSSNGGSDFRLMRLDLSSGAESEILRRTFFEITSLRWLPDSNDLLLAAKETLDGRLRIWQASIATGESRAVTKDAADYISISLDQAARKMIATLRGNTFHLYLAKLSDVSNPKNLVVARTGIAFAPDGKIVYEGNDGDIWTINRDGGEQRQLTNNSFYDFDPRISPDGGYIFFTSNRSGSNQLWRMNADGSNQIQLTKREGGFPRFVTPDGRLVYFYSGLHQDLWSVSTEGGDETQVSLPSSAFSPDGNLIAHFFRDKEGDHRLKLAFMSAADRRVVQVFKVADDKSLPLGIDWSAAWSGDNKNFYYITSDGSRNSLWCQSLEVPNPRLVGDLGNEEIAHFAVSADGTSFAFIRGRWIHDAVLIEGLK